MGNEALCDSGSDVALMIYPQADASAFIHFGNEGSFLMGEESSNLWQGFDVSGSHISASQIAGDKNERSDSGAEQGYSLKLVVANLFVFGQNNPFSAATLGQPEFIGRIVSEMISVNFDMDPCLAKG